ncbi:Uncharacterised protein [Pseudomonas aeruginosa]|nr:Uncharacterised protein [Pseudomonas aeruginosa]
MQALVLREQFRQQYLPLLHRLRGDPRQAEFLADLQSLQNQRRAFSIHTRLRAGDLGVALGPVGHFLHERQALHRHGFARHAPAIHAADGVVFDAERELGVGQRACCLLHGFGDVNLQLLRAYAWALLLRDKACLSKIEGVGYRRDKRTARQRDADSFQTMHSHRGRRCASAVRRRAPLGGAKKGSKHGCPRNWYSRNHVVCRIGARRARTHKSIPQDLEREVDRRKARAGIGRNVGNVPPEGYPVENQPGQRVGEPHHVRREKLNVQPLP